MTKRRTLAFMVVAAALVIVGLIYWGVSWFLYTPDILTPRESALKQTNQLLAIIQDSSSETQPDDLPGYLRTMDCWELLKTEMKQSSNEYYLEVTYEYDSKNDPAAVHDMIEVHINIIFPDGNRVEIDYFNGGLTSCRLID